MENEFRVQLVDFETEIQVFFRKTNSDGKRYTVKVIETEEVEQGRPIQPFTSIDHKAAQVLMDDLWSCGIRPTEGRGSAGALTATEKHLNDMRKIAFKQIGIKDA